MIPRRGFGKRSDAQLFIHASTRLRSMMSANILSFGSDRCKTILMINILVVSQTMLTVVNQ